MESDDVKVKVPKVINSVRDKAMLEDFLRIVQTKVNEYNMKMGKGSVLRVAPVQWTVSLVCPICFFRPMLT